MTAAAAALTAAAVVMAGCSHPRHESTAASVWASLGSQIPRSIGTPSGAPTTITATAPQAPAAAALPIPGPFVAITSGAYPRDGQSWAYAALPAPGVTVYQRETDGDLAGCTIGFPVVDAANRLGFLSAGHCDQHTGGGLTMRTAATGADEDVSITLGGYAGSVDDQSITATSAPIPGGAARDYTLLSLGGQSNIGYRTEIAHGVRLRGVMDTDMIRALPVGTILCKNGARTGITCGPLIAADDRDLTWGGHVEEGDSGAAVFAVNAAGEALGVGIASGYDADGRTVVTYLRPALLQLGVALVTG
jgi:hypothetical protein